MQKDFDDKINDFSLLLFYFVLLSKAKYDGWKIKSGGTFGFCTVLASFKHSLKLNKASLIEMNNLSFNFY